MFECSSAFAQPLQSCLTFCDTMYCSSPGSSVCEILQARILKWVDISFSSSFATQWYYNFEPNLTSWAINFSHQ